MSRVEGVHRKPGARSAAVLVACGGLVLAFGLLVAMADRPPWLAALMPAAAALAGGPFFGPLGQWLPSFVHPFAFSLFTAAAWPPGPSSAYRACAAWWAVNVIFEVAQQPAIAAAVAGGLEAAFGRNALTRSLANYLLRGTFDVGDLVAATAGALAAAGVLFIVRH